MEQTLDANSDARVLIASQTNVAVDNALQRLADGGQASMVRLASADPNRVDESVRHLLLDAQMKRWARTVRKNAESHLGARATEAGLEPAHLRAALALQQLVHHRVAARLPPDRPTRRGRRATVRAGDIARRSRRPPPRSRRRSTPWLTFATSWSRRLSRSWAAT